MAARSRTILHLDMDAFFAAIEQHDHPQWRGRPLVVGADPKGGRGRGVVSTCSYEARRYGIHSAMPISRAFQLCPTAVYVLPRGSRYTEVSRQVMKILGDFSPDVEPISIDEAFIDITSTKKLHGSAEALAREIKFQVTDITGLTCSIGIAPNKFIAKIASDLRKPDGLVTVEPEGVTAFLAPLEINRLWGVGLKTAPLLQSLGIHTIGDLARYSQQQLIEQFGASGLHFWRLANGLDDRPVGEDAEAKSMSRETTFERDIFDEAEMRNTLFALCDDLAYDMRRCGWRGRTVTLKIRLADFSTFTRSQSFLQATGRSEEIFQRAAELFASFERNGQAVRLLGVAMSHLEQGEGQMDLFANDDESAAKMDRVMDEVRKKFGVNAIGRASLLKSRRDSQWIRE